LADALEKVGKDGLITIDEGRNIETTMDTVEGLRFDRGYISPYFITNQEKLDVELVDALVLIHEKKLTTMAEVVPALELAAKLNRALLVIAEDVEGEALAALTLNKLRGVVRAAAAKAPAFGERRKEVLRDIAAVTGASPFMEGDGRKVDESLQLSDLGSAKKVLMDKENTTIVGGGGTKEAIQGRIKLIHQETEATNSDYDKMKLKERLAKLAGGVAVISVGGSSDVELREKKQRYEDALASTQAAVEEGFVAGGGVALIRAAAKLTDLQGLPEDERLGVKLLQEVCAAPLEQIAANSGEEPKVVAARVKEGSGAFGYNARSGQFEDLVKAGVIDPVKVVRLALSNASSVAGLLLTTECIVSNKPEPPKGPSVAGPGQGGMGGGMGGRGGMGGGDDHHHDDFDM
jgi:chaperonin GroEL